MQFHSFTMHRGDGDRVQSQVLVLELVLFPLGQSCWRQSSVSGLDLELVLFHLVQLTVFHLLA